MSKAVEKVNKSCNLAISLFDLWSFHLFPTPTPRENGNALVSKHLWPWKTGMTTVWQLDVIDYSSDAGSCLLNIFSPEENANSSAKSSIYSLSSTHQFYLVLPLRQNQFTLAL